MESTDAAIFLVAGVGLLGWLVVAVSAYRQRLKLDAIKHLPESMKEGSALVTVPLAMFPFVVGIFSVKKKRPDKREFKGTGIILDGYVLTANHAIDAVKPALNDKKTECDYDLYCRTHDNVYHLLGDWTQLHTDAIAFKAPPGYKSGKVETLTRPQHVQVVAAREQSNSSMGILRNKPDVAYGFIEYDGSTIAGFSGSPYTNGQKVLGMHLQGGTGGNFGYSASFLTTLLRKKMKPESSEWAAFERALAQAAQDEVEWDRGLDETQVRVGGRYFLFENEEFDTYIEESEFMDWFYEDYGDAKDSKKFRFRKTKRSQREEVFDEPEYEGGDNSFLEQPAHQDLSGQDLKKDIDSLKSSIQSIQNTMILIQKDLVGLQEQGENWKRVSMSMQQLDQKLQEQQLDQLPKKVSILEQNLTELTKSVIENRRTSMTQNGISASEQSSEPSTQQVVQGSENSENIQQSAKRWAGMESDFAKFKTWRCSVNVLDPEYVALREEFLRSINLEPWQSKILTSRMSNYLKKLKNRKLMRDQRTTESNSS